MEIKDNGSPAISEQVNSLLKKEGELLARAVAQTMRRYHENPTAKNLRDLEAAKKAMKEVEQKQDNHELALQEAHAKALTAVKKKTSTENVNAAVAAEKALAEYRARKAAEANPGERRFANTLEVLGYLTSEGWKVGKSKLYEDCGRGRLLPGKDGAYSLKDIENYAKDNLGKLDGSDIDAGLANQKTRIEIDLLKVKKKKEERLDDTISRKLVLRTEVEQRFTNRLALFKTGLENLVYGATTEHAVEIVGGNMEKLHEMQDFLMKNIRDILAGYSKSLQFSIPRKAILEAMEEKEEDAG